MYLNLEDLGLRGGQGHEDVYSVEVAPVSWGGAEYEVLLPEGLTLAAKRVAGGYLVRLEGEAKIYGPCSRCLSEAHLVVRVEQEEFVPTAAGGWADSESSPFIDGMVVDISGLGREVVVLAMPERITCSPSCRGICPECGQDLNRGQCGCSTLEISDPMR